MRVEWHPLGPWALFGFGLIGHVEVRSPVDFTMVAMKHSLNKDIKGCRERQGETQMLCKETLLRAAVTAFLKCHLFLVRAVDNNTIY